MGDRVEAVGFSAVVDFRPVLLGALYRVTGSGPPQAPLDLTPAEALNDKFDSALVRMEGVLSAISELPDKTVLILNQGSNVFTAFLKKRRPTERRLAFRESSHLQVTGICLNDEDIAYRTDDLVSKRFRIRLRSPADVVQTGSPSWWTRGRALLAIAFLTIAVVAISTWVMLLRHKVRATDSSPARGATGG